MGNRKGYPWALQYGFWASGACFLVRTDAWLEVGGLDEDFFAHMEEIDLCWRLRNRGMTVGVTSKCHVYHLGGGTLQQENPTKAYLNFRNNLFLLLKNDHRFGIHWRILFRQILDGIAGLRFLLEGKPEFVRAILRAHRDYRHSRNKMMAKRRKEISICDSANAEADVHGMYNGSIIWAFFFQGKKRFSDLDENFFAPRR